MIYWAELYQLKQNLLLTTFAPTTPAPTTRAPITTSPPRPTMEAVLDIGRRRRSVLDVEQVSDALADLYAKSSETTKGILDRFVSKINAAVTKNGM